MTCIPPYMLYMLAALVIGNRIPGIIAGTFGITGNIRGGEPTPTYMFPPTGPPLWYCCVCDAKIELMAHLVALCRPQLNRIEIGRAHV